MHGKIVAVVGNTAVGKTTLVSVLRQRFSFRAGMEQHEERPFQRRFFRDHRRFALANQVDYLLYRAEQERALRRTGGVGILDGGLDMDFRVFTRLFRQRGYLDADEYGLCERLFHCLRAGLPPPDLIIWLRAPLDIVAGRFAARSRALSIAGVEDLPDLEHYLEEWLSGVTGSDLQVLDVAAEGLDYEHALAELQPKLRQLGLVESAA